MRKHNLFLILYLIVGMTFPALAWEKTLSTAPAGPYKAKKYCKLNYKMSWNGKLNSGEYSIEFQKNTGVNKTIEVRSSGKSIGFIRKIFPYNFNAVSKYNGSTLRPVSYHIWEKTKDKSKKLDGYFNGSTVKLSKVETDSDTGKVKSKKLSYSSPNLHDLFSCTLYIGSQPLKNGDKVNLVVYPFDKPYLVKVHVLGREKHNGQNCIKMDLQLKKIEKDGSLTSYEKMKKTTMWLSDDANRIMVDLRAKIFIGDVRATLDSSEWK